MALSAAEIFDFLPGVSLDRIGSEALCVIWYEVGFWLLKYFPSSGRGLRRI
jgi:hypothetical protein